MNREDQKKRDGEIIAAVETGTPVTEVAALYAVSPRTVRHVRQKWRERGMDEQGGPERTGLTLQAAVARALLRRFLADSREQDRRLAELSERAADDQRRVELALGKAEIATSYLKPLAPILGADALRLGRRRRPEQESIAELNAEIRATLAEHGASAEAIEAALEVVIRWYAEMTGLWEMLRVPRRDS